MTDPRLDLLTSDDVAALFKMPRASLHKGTSRGLLPRGTRIPGLGLRWRRSDVEAWVARQFAERGASRGGAAQ